MVVAALARGAARAGGGRVDPVRLLQGGTLVLLWLAWEAVAASG